MSESRLLVEIVTPAGGVVYSREASHIRLPGATGHFGILPGHTELMAALGLGIAEVDELGGEHRRLSMAGGFVQVQEDCVQILAEAAELPEQVDRERAEAARARAQERLDHPRSGVDDDRARLALLRALNRLSLLS